MNHGYWPLVGGCIDMLQCQFEAYFGGIGLPLEIALG
jgi:hypothetical protein